MKQSLHSEVLHLLSALFSLSSQAAICRFSMILTPQGPFQGFSPSPKHGALFFRHVCTGPFLDLSEWSFSLSFVLTSYCMKLSILVLPCAPLPVAHSFILYLYLYQHIKTNYNSWWTTTASHPFPQKPRWIEDWKGVGALGGNKSPANADIIRGTER